MKLFNLTPLEAAGYALAWGLVLLLVLTIVIFIVLVARAGYKAIREFGSVQNGRK